VIFDAGPWFGGDHGVDSGFFGGLDVARYGLDQIVCNNSFNRRCDRCGRAECAVEKGDEKCRRRRAEIAAVAAEADRAVGGEALS